MEQGKRIYLLCSIRVGKNSNEIADLEVASYPHPITLPVGFCSLDFSYSPRELQEALLHHLQGKVAIFSKHYRNEQQDIYQNILDNRNSFPPEKNGKYSDTQRGLFLHSNVLRLLYPRHQGFLQKQADSGGLIIECFLSVYMQVLAIFLEYYVQGKTGHPSDLIDLYQLCYLPYVNLSVLDNERNDLIARINRLRLLPQQFMSLNLKDFKNSLP